MLEPSSTVAAGSPQVPDVVAAYLSAQAADNAWSLELRRLFGKNAGDVRYTKQGEGEPGTKLRSLYVAFAACQKLYHQAIDAAVESEVRQ